MDQIQICNMALGWCGANMIMSLDDESIEADLCAVAYDPTRDLVLEQKDWTFAASRTMLTPSPDAPAFGYSYKFTLPADLLCVRQVSDMEDMRKIDFVKEQNEILCNVAGSLYLKYTLAIDNETAFSPSYTYSFAHKLAAVIAIPLTENRALKQEMEQMSIMYQEAGGSIDGTQTKVGRAYASKLIAARFK